MRTFKRLKSFFSSGETRRGRRNVLHTMHDSQIIRHYILDRAGIMFVSLCY